MYNRQEYNRGYENHIQDEREYKDALRRLKKGERWKMDDLMARSDIDFNQEEFTPHDYAYMVNAMYSDYSISERPEQYMKMAKEHLRNDSFPERGGERAFYDAQSRAQRYNNRYENYNGYKKYGNQYSERNSYRDRDNDGRYNE